MLYQELKIKKTVSSHVETNYHRRRKLKKSTPKNSLYTSNSKTSN